MAYFAELNENNVVLRVIVVDDAILLDESGNKNEYFGMDYCRNLFGGRWIETGHENGFRKNFAAIGGYYEPMRDAFILPQPAPDWILDDVNCVWIAPPVAEPVVEPVSLVNKLSTLLGVK
jgi:hypothetical protein